MPERGLFPLKRMPYRLSGAPATFQRMINKLITPELDSQASAYLDNEIIATETFEEHLLCLELVLRQITDAWLTINEAKSEFCVERVQYLVFLVDKHEVHIDPEKTSVVLGYPARRTVRQVRQFLGMASWYRRFISNFAARSEPINKLLKKNRPWSWKEEQQIAFEDLKRALTIAPNLACPDFSVYPSLYRQTQAIPAQVQS